MRSIRRTKGFTLIELAIAIAIIAVLSVTVIVGGRYLIAGSKPAKLTEAVTALVRGGNLLATKPGVTIAVRAAACDGVTQMQTAGAISMACPYNIDTTTKITDVGFVAGGAQMGMTLLCASVADCVSVWNATPNKRTVALTIGTMAACTIVTPTTTTPTICVNLM